MTGNTSSDGPSGEVQRDEEEFEHAGLNCQITDANGHWCGYVQTPDDLPPVRWTSDYNSKYGEVLDAEVEVHGGITYGPDDDGWVGFDDAHARSLVEFSEEETSKAAARAETESLAEQIAELTEGDDAREGKPVLVQERGTGEYGLHYPDAGVIETYDGNERVELDVDALAGENWEEADVEDLQASVDAEIEEARKEIDELRSRDLSDVQEQELDRIESRLDSQANVLELVREVADDG